MGRHLALQLGLTPTRTNINMQVADGSSVPATAYMGILDIPDLAFRGIVEIHTVKMKYPSSRVLLGRSFLENFIVTFNGPDGMFHFARTLRLPEANLEDDFAT
jgi:hypothetical protein